MTKNEYLAIKDNFLDLFSSEMLKLGFNKKGTTTFVIKTELGSKFVSVALSAVRGYMDTHIGALIRFDELEKLLYQYRLEVLNEKRLDKFSIGGNIGRIRSDVFRRWQIYPFDDIHKEVNDILEIIKTAIMPFFEKYGDNLLAAYEGLIDRKMGSILSPDVTRRLETALALTFIMKRHDLFLELSSEGAERLAKHPNGDERRFLQLRDWLNLKFQEEI